MTAGSTTGLHRLRQAVDDFEKSREASRNLVCQDLVTETISRLCRHCECAVSLGMPCVRFFLSHRAFLPVGSADAITELLLDILKKSRIEFYALSPLVLVIQLPTMRTEGDEPRIKKKKNHKGNHGNRKNRDMQSTRGI